MTTYVDKDTLLHEMQERHEDLARDYGDYDNYVMGFGDAIELLENASAADVREVKHANWVHLGGDEWCCTCCGFVITTEGAWEEPAEKYCSYCGAKMGGKHEQTT